MSKNTGIGRKRITEKISDGLDKCDVAAHSKQCGRAKKVTKGQHFKQKNRTP